ncbi:hypothetical protein [Helicobacter mehlei]|uniref:Uncharacterized protein n=1 Tax=Helicobacter mehlei TaxID=2316080 RepID=A0A553UMQ9_9HELI|nr:hypothetical protein [Helicobacter mehlei]TSA81494.1 hypothetical protein FNE76_06575 [Helicobacter mehlei]
MNINRFIRNFLEVRQALGGQNFPTKELNATAMQAAIEYEKLYLQEAQNNLAEEQARAKMEIDYLNAQYTLQASKAQTLNALIQCQSMITSLKDNAAINRANAYVSFLNTVGNASNTSAIAAYAREVTQTIRLIGDEKPDPLLQACLQNLGKELERLNGLEGASEVVQIFAQSLETLPDHPVRIWGFSTLKDAQDSFLVDGVEITRANSFLFQQSTPKSYKITFKSTNQNGEAQKSIDIQVRDQAIRGLK